MQLFWYIVCPLGGSATLSWKGISFGKPRAFTLDVGGWEEGRAFSSLETKDKKIETFKIKENGIVYHFKSQLQKKIY